MLQYKQCHSIFIKKTLNMWKLNNFLILKIAIPKQETHSSGRLSLSKP